MFESPERWRPVVGWPGYEISNHGRIRSWKRGAQGKILSQYVVKGYRAVNLVGFDGRRISARIHRLVAEAFLGEPKEGETLVRHLDGDTDNNQARNLAWGSWSDNENDKRRHGRTPTGEKHHAAKLTWEQVRHIRAAKGETATALARKYGVSIALVSRIRRGQLWQHSS